MSWTTISYNSNGFIIIFLSVAHDWAQESLALTKQQTTSQRLQLHGGRQRPEFTLLLANRRPRYHIAECCAHRRQRKPVFILGYRTEKVIGCELSEKLFGFIMSCLSREEIVCMVDKELLASVGTEDHVILKTHFLSLLHKSTIVWGRKIIFFAGEGECFPEGI